MCKDFFDKLYARTIKYSSSESINKNKEILSQILQLKSHKENKTFNIHTYIQKYIHTYIHTYMDTYHTRTNLNLIKKKICYVTHLILFIVVYYE